MIVAALNCQSLMMCLIISMTSRFTTCFCEALRGVRGVLQVSVRDAGWEEKMYKELGVGDYGMFKQVLRRVAVELQKMPDNPANYPILLLEVPRRGALFVVLLGV